MSDHADHSGHHDPNNAARSPPGQWRLLAAALLCWAVTAWAITKPGTSTVVSLICLSSGACMLVWQLLVRLRTRAPSSPASGTHWAAAAATRMIALFLLPLALIALVGTRASGLEYARADPIFAEAARLHTAVSFEATLSGYPKRRSTPFGDRAWVRVTANTARGTVPMLLWLEANDVPQHWGPGVILAVSSRLQAQAPADPAAYTATPLTLREITHTSNARLFGSPLIVQAAHTAAQLRHSLVQHAAQVPGAELVPGFAVGDTSLVSERLNSYMLESSLSHLTAVSGSNTGLVVAAVIWCVSRAGGGRKLRVIAAVLSLAAFLLIVGPDASVQRATVMAIVLLLGGFGGRRATALPALGLAIIVLLTLDPWQALQPGFSLSVAATGGILLIAPPATRFLRRSLRLPSVIALPVAVALAAWLACGPLLLLLQPGLPIAGILANLIAAPAVPIGTGLGLLATIAHPFSPWLADLTVQAASVASRWVAATAEVCATLPGARWNWPEGWAGAVALASCQLALLAAWALRHGHLSLPRIGRATRRQPWQPAPPGKQGIRLTVTVLVSASAAVIIAVSVITPLAVTVATPRSWAVVACDIGQGDAILLRDPDHPQEVMLVDTGDDEHLLERCLQRFDVTRISLLVLSHDDRDHVGALPAITERVDAALIAPTIRGAHTRSRHVVHLLEQADIPYRVAEQGDGHVTASGAGISWRVLAPENHTPPADNNAASLVMIAHLGSTSVLLLGDTGFAQQSALQRALQAQGDTQTLQADVLKVAHHGSRDQDHTLPLAVRAQWALISVGADNSYGHPAADTLAALTRAGSTPLRTDLYGSIALVPQPDGALKPWVEHVAAVDR